MNEENEWDHKLSAEVKEGPADCIISVSSPDNPGALCLFISFIAALTSSILIQSAGPSLTSADNL